MNKNNGYLLRLADQLNVWSFDVANNTKHHIM